MKHKALFILAFSMLLLIFTVVLEGRIKGIIQYKKAFITKEKYEKLTSSKISADEPLITDVYIDNQHLIYDTAANTFYCSQIENQDFETVSMATSQNNSLSEVLGINPIRIRFYDNKIIMYNNNTISTSDFVITTLPILNVAISAETVMDLQLDETYNIEEYTGGEMYLFDNRADFDGKTRSITNDIKLHIRGGTTIGLPQKSYRITLINDSENLDSSNVKQNLLGLREDDDWILYSMYSDYEKIRNVFCMNLWNEMAENDNEWKVADCNEYKYVEVFFNNRYHGLYALGYPLDNKQFGLKNDESIIQKKDWMKSEFALDVEYNENYGFDWLAGYYLKDGPADSYYVIHDLLYAMAYSKDCETIRETVDIKNAINLYLFYNFTQAVDNLYLDGVKNLFVVNKRSDNEFGYKLLFAPWDMDQTLGNRYSEGEGNHGITSYHMPTDYELPIAWSPVFFLMENGDSNIANEVKQQYSYLRKTTWSDEHINDLIDSYEYDIYKSGAFERNMQRWPDGNYYDSEKELEDFRNYVLERLKYMDNFVSGL